MMKISDISLNTINSTWTLSFPFPSPQSAQRHIKRTVFSQQNLELSGRRNKSDYNLFLCEFSSQANLFATYRNFTVSTTTSIVHVKTVQTTAQVLLQKDCKSLHAVACHPKKPIVVTGNGMGVLKVWDYNRKVIICSRVFEPKKNIQCVTFDPQGEPRLADCLCMNYIFSFGSER